MNFVSENRDHILIELIRGIFRKLRYLWEMPRRNRHKEKLTSYREGFNMGYIEGIDGYLSKDNARLRRELDHYRAVNAIPEIKKELEK